MKKDLFKGKLGRKRLLSLILPIAFVLVFLFQFWFTSFAEKKQLFVDLTSEGLYTLTDKMIEECSYLPSLEKELKITFCSDPDSLRGSVRTRVVYFMCLALQKAFPSLKPRAPRAITLRSHRKTLRSRRKTLWDKEESIHV